MYWVYRVREGLFAESYKFLRCSLYKTAYRAHPGFRGQYFLVVAAALHLRMLIGKVARLRAVRALMGLRSGNATVHRTKKMVDLTSGLQWL